MKSITRNNKMEYEALEMEIVRIDMEDVLNASLPGGGPHDPIPGEL